MNRRTIFAGAVVLTLGSVVLSLGGKPDPIIDLDLTQYPHLPAVQVGDLVRVRGIAHRVDRGQTGWRAHFNGRTTTCHLEDGSGVVPGETVKIVGRVQAVGETLVVVDCRQD